MRSGRSQTGVGAGAGCARSAGRLRAARAKAASVAPSARAGVHRAVCSSAVVTPKASQPPSRLAGHARAVAIHP